MELRIDPVQPELTDTLIRPPPAPRALPRIQPVEKNEAAVFRKDEEEPRNGRDQAPRRPSEAGAVKEIVDKPQAYLEDLNIRLDFEVHEETGELIVRVFNRETGKLIREVPPEDLLELHEKLAELRGVLFDQKA